MTYKLVISIESVQGNGPQTSSYDVYGEYATPVELLKTYWNLMKVAWLGKRVYVEMPNGEQMLVNEFEYDNVSI